MKKITFVKNFTSFLATLLFTVNGYCQNDDSHQTYSTVICEYNLPIGRSGLSVTAFNVTPSIRLDRGNTATIYLNIKALQGSSTNPNPSFKHSYNFLGKQYGNQDVGYEPFQSIRAENLTYEVLVTYGSKIWGWTEVDGKDNVFGPIDKNAKASEINVRVRVVNLMFSGTNVIENRIRDLLKASADKKIAEESQKKEQEKARLQKIEDDKIEAKKQQEQIKSTSPTTKNTSYQKNNSDSTISNKTAGNSSSKGAGNQDGNSILSDKVKINNGETVQVFRQAGKNYIQYADGRTVETNQTNYDAIQNAANKNAAQKAEQESKANAAKELQIAINKANEEEHQARQAARQAKAELTAQVVTQAAGLVGELLNDWAENARKKEAYQAKLREEQVERDRIAEENRQKKIKKIALHTNYITTIKDAKLPLSSEDIDEEIIYYFAFNIDKTALATTTPKINLTGIFPIAKYNDGTWPYAANIKKDLSTVLKNTDVVLNGYYRNRNEAETDFAIFKETLETLNFTITSFEYKGKTKEVKSNNDDIWNDTGNKTKPKVSNDDFWKD